MAEKAANDNFDLKKLAKRFMELFGKTDGKGLPRHANSNVQFSARETFEIPRRTNWSAGMIPPDLTSFIEHIHLSKGEHFIE